MKSKSIIYLLILVFTTTIGFWCIPSLIKKATDTRNDYPFIYYSSLLKDLCFIDFVNDEFPMYDRKGNTYTQAQFDSLLPLLNFRQLIIDGNLPDSIDGHKIDGPQIRMKNVVYRYAPDVIHTPETGLYIMYEAMPKRVNEEMPQDVFRFSDCIEFIDIKSNTTDTKKSTTFQKAIEKVGYTFPSQWISGNMNPMKSYDEGYFSLDSKGELFHIKMVNGRPFVRNTHIGELIDIDHFVMTEVADMRFYGFLFDKDGFVYIIEENGGKYKPLKLDMDALDIQKDEMLIMGNLLYWTVTVTRPDRLSCYALKTETLEQVTKHEIMGTPSRWNIAAAWLFPLYINFEHANTKYIYPHVSFTGYSFLVIHIILVILVFFFIPNTRKQKLLHSMYVLFTGIVGLLALFLLPGFREK